eukprot:7378169-Prymnesium_polylepis.1
MSSFHSSAHLASSRMSSTARQPSRSRVRRPLHRPSGATSSTALQPVRDTSSSDGQLESAPTSTSRVQPLSCSTRSLVLPRSYSTAAMRGQLTTKRCWSDGHPPRPSRVARRLQLESSQRPHHPARGEPRHLTHARVGQIAQFEKLPDPVPLDSKRELHALDARPVATRSLGRSGANRRSDDLELREKRSADAAERTSPHCKVLERGGVVPERPVDVLDDGHEQLGIEELEQHRRLERG